MHLHVQCIFASRLSQSSRNLEAALTNTTPGFFCSSQPRLSPVRSTAPKIKLHHRSENHFPGRHYQAHRRDSLLANVTSSLRHELKTCSTLSPVLRLKPQHLYLCAYERYSSNYGVKQTPGILRLWIIYRFKLLRRAWHPRTCCLLFTSSNSPEKTFEIATRFLWGKNCSFFPFCLNFLLSVSSCFFCGKTSSSSSSSSSSALSFF